jgi:hypothetical protein
MISRRGFAGVLLGAVVLGVAGCGSAAKDRAEVRYRMTVEVETPDGVKSGSSVWSFKLQQPDLALASPFDSDFAGEAVAVDLPNRRTLFALVKDQEMLPERHFRQFNHGNGGNRIANIRSIAANTGATATLSCKPIPEDASTLEASKPEYDCPILVTFGDLADPKTVERVDPEKLGASFGKGYRLKAITVAVTDEPVTSVIEKRFPQEFWKKWAAQHKEQVSRNGGIMNNPYFQTLAGILSRNDFTSESSK